MFTVNDRGQIVYGLGAIKGLGEGPVESIIAARNSGGPFKNLFDFCERTDPRKVNKRAIEALIRSGAFDDLGEDRAVLMAAMPEAVQVAEQAARNVESGMVDLFGETLAADNRDVYAAFRDVRRWTTKERLQGEKDTLGLYVTGHPIDDYEAELRRFVPRRIVDLNPEKHPQTVAGLAVNMRTMKNKRGDTMAFLLLDDRSARIEIALFSDVYEECREQLVKDAVLVVEGVCSFDEYSGGKKMRVKSIRSLAEAREHHAKELEVALDAACCSSEQLQKLKSALGPVRGGSCPVVIRYRRPEGEVRLRLGSEWRILPQEDVLIRLREDCGANNVVINYD